MIFLCGLTLAVWLLPPLARTLRELWRQYATRSKAEAAVPSNAVAHAPWGRYGLAEDTFWLPATNWAFVLGTNAAEGAHVSSSGTLSFDSATPKGSPRAAAMPDGDTLSFLAPLQGSLGTVPPQGRFWHAVTTNGSVLMTWQDLYAGRDTNSPVTFQAELFRNGDFSYRYAFSSNSSFLTPNSSFPFAVGAQHNGGGETYALNDTNRLANGLELRWRAFGMLDPGVDDHDGDGLSTYDEVMTWDTDPAMPDTDLDGLGDAAETAAGLNPLARDSDGDGIPDGSDPHPLDPSGDTVDADGDGLPDVWESHWFGSTNATDSAEADTNGDGFSDRANLLSGANPAFAACVVTASGGSHTFTWTVLPDATNYAATVTRGGAAVWSCLTNVCLLSVTGDYSTAVHTLTITSYGGVTSRTASVTFRQPSQPNLTVWKIADPFALELPQGCTNVLERAFRINRSDAWQQYFVSSGHDSAGAWALDGLRLDWSDSGGDSGSAAASPAGDSLRLAVSTNSPQTLTVRIVPDGAGGLVRSPKPLYLLGWSPAVTFSSNGFCVYIWDDGECGSCGSCEDGDCSSAEGESPGSVRFRIPLGFTGNKQMAGFVWFHLETPQALTPATFTVTGDASVQTEHANAGGALSRAFSVDPGGRDVRFVPVTGGVRVSVRDTGDAAEDRAWLITSDAGSVTFRQTDSAANTVLDVSYVQLWPGYWVRTDNATGLTKTRLVSGSVTNGVEFTEDIVRDGASLVLSGRRSSRTLVGAGPAAVEREIRRCEWDGAAQVWRETRMTWWTDSLNPLLNGRPKFRYGDGGDWEYRAHDARGRETLRAEPLDGSAHPFFKDDAQPFAFSPAASYASLTGLVTVTSYAPAPGDGGALNDSRKPREVAVYAVRGGAPWLISREWRVYARATNDVWQTVTQRVIRAASPAAGPDDQANARTLNVAYADDDDAVPALLRGRPLREERGDGTLLTWEYALDVNTLTVTAKRGTAAHPDGLANVSTYEVETFDAVFGRALGRETRLYTGAAGGVLLASETMTYDAQGRLLATTYSDGTSEINVWGCCRLDAKIGRDGTRTDYGAVPGNSHWSVVEETSLGGLPGAGGSHPAVETFTDALGRETNSVRCVWRNSSRDSAYAPLATGTAYPYGTDSYNVMTDPLGVQTLTRTYYEGNAKITETASAGVTNRTLRVRGGAVVEEKYWDGKWTRETRSTSHDAAGRRVETVTAEASDCPVFTKSVTTYDFLGRAVSVSTPNSSLLTPPSYSVTSNFYDGASDRVLRMSRTGSPDTLYVYDELGNVTATALDVDGDGQVSYAGTDRISATGTRYEEDAANIWWRVTSSAVWSQAGVDACLTSAVTRVRMTGFGGAAPSRISANAILTAQSQTVDGHGNATLNSIYADAGSAGAWQVTESPFSTQAVIRVSTAGAPVTDISASCVTNTYAYDGFARRAAATDGRGNTSRTIFNSLGQVEYTEDAASNRTAYAYDALGRQVSVSSPLSNTVFTAYDSLGNVIRTWGATYPVEYGYDFLGRKLSMKTFRDENGNGDETRWLYDSVTGLLTNKVYADGKGTAYGYTTSGRLATRAWARGVTTGYAYDDFGQLTGINYSDATPDVAFAYDRLGRMTSATTPVSTNLFEHAGFDLVTETQNGVTVTRSYDDLGRSVGFNMSTGYAVAYGYDTFGRFAAVSSSVAAASSVASYSYVPGADLVASMTNSSGFAWSSVYERDRDLIASVENAFAANLISAYAYDNDADGRRTLRIDSTPALSVTNAFAYNIRAEVTNAVMGASKYGYGYDDIGNRLVSSVNAFSISYTANTLNQYTAIAGAMACSPAYDWDGNMTYDGDLYNTWDAENRLICSEPGSVVTNGSVRVNNKYDHMNRRVQKTVRQLSGRGSGYPLDPSQPGTWNVIETRKYVWDNWNIAAEIVTIESAGTTNINFNTWGLDLSGSLQGAGGVGGLLAVVETSGSATNMFFAGADANGNVTAYVDDDGTAVAQYEYSAVGETTAKSGSMADDFTHRFSTKPFDVETGYSKYQQRDLISPLARWASRDPIEENGGLNLFGFVGNQPVSRYDALGYCECGISDFKMTNRGWTKQNNGYSLTFTIEYKYLTDKKYSSSCCRYVQWIQSVMMLNGSSIHHSQGGTPLDNKLHVDTSPVYEGDDIMQSGATWRNESPTPDRFKTTDNPGIHGLQDGDVFLDSNVFVGRVYDICHGNKIVAQQSFKMKVSGVWPNPKYSP